MKSIKNKASLVRKGHLFPSVFEVDGRKNFSFMAQDKFHIPIDNRMTIIFKIGSDII